MTDSDTSIDWIDTDRAEQMATDHSTSGPHDRSGHSLINDWDIKTHYCVDCGIVSLSAAAIEATECEQPEQPEPIPDPLDGIDEGGL